MGLKEFFSTISRHIKKRENIAMFNLLEFYFDEEEQGQDIEPTEMDISECYRTRLINEM
ncbi:MAG: hypothetical protein PHX18_03815 [Candidatus Gastranaerophilales bacterium]|nr:hypothetical protein [Candidatus Gastranaerophilales bacterium]